MESLLQYTVLPLDVVQIVLGYVADVKTLCAARQACKSWRQAAAAAPAVVKVALPNDYCSMKSKLALLLQLMPGVSGIQATIAAGAEPVYTAECFQALLSFQNLRQLDLSFADSQELAPGDVEHLAALKRLTCLRLNNVSLPAGIDSSPLTVLTGLTEVSLVHHSKVSALMVGDSHLQVLGKLQGLRQLVLQGRMCSATDDGLLSLTGLASLTSLSVSWVPWQSQITQRAALALLASLTQLKSLQLGGAELLLPSTPYYPSGAPATTPVLATSTSANAILGIGIRGLGHQQHHQQPGPLVAVAGARAELLATASGSLSAVSGSSSAAAAVAPGVPITASQGEVMRRVLAAKADDLATFKLQFNCCGTGVEKSLLSLGDIRQRLTGLQWSYAKLSGPSCVSLLASCTNLRSLKLRLWYQDYNLTPFEFSLTDLSTLIHLRTLVIDKRPPFQQQLPAQQAAISVPITTRGLTRLSTAWPHLEKLQLGLSRSDFGSTPLEGLAGFTKLRSLSVHCYDQGYDDGHFMVPINVAALPPGLVKLDLMHAELFSSNPSGSGVVRSQATGSSTSGSKVDATCSSGSLLKSHNSGSFSCKACSSSSSSSRSGFTQRVTFGAATALTSMLSESFSLLSRQGSAECSSAYLEKLIAQQESATAAAAAVGASPSTAVAAAAVAAAAMPVNLTTVHQSGLTEPNSSGWLNDLLDTSSRQQAGSSSSVLMQRPPLPKQHSLSMPGSSHNVLKSRRSVQQPGCSNLVTRHAGKPTVLAADNPHASAAASRSSSSSTVAAAKPKPKLQNPFAVAAAAAAVHAEVGGCVAAVDPMSPEALAAAAAPRQPHLTEPGRSKPGSSLGMSFSLTFGFGSSSSKTSKSAAAASPSCDYAALCGAMGVPSLGLPLLQHLQLKHCALDGIGMVDIVTAPGELRSLQLVEVAGVSAPDIALMPSLVQLQRLTLIAAKEDAWLGLAPLRLLCKLPDLRHLDWVVSERALPKSNKTGNAADLQALCLFPKLQVVTLHTVLGKCEQLHAVSAKLQSGCHVRLMAPAYCEHASSRKSGSKISKLLSAASCLIPGTGY